MRFLPKLALLCALLAAGGCQKPHIFPEGPLPPHTVLLSQMMRQVSARPGFTDGLLADLGKSTARTAHGNKKGPALLTPKLLDELRGRIFGNDWQGLDRFPGWSMREINPTVRTVGHEAGKSEKLEGASAVHPGAATLGGAGPSAERDAREFLDVGPYAMNREGTEALDTLPHVPGFEAAAQVTSLGAGVVRGDGPNQLAPEHAASQRLADVLNRLAGNTLPGAAPFKVTKLPWLAETAEHDMDRLLNPITTPEGLVADLLSERSGETVTVDDARYFANFGHFHLEGNDVMMPFWINSEAVVPHSGGRPLLIPVSHAEYEWHIRGPELNADVSYYYGVDGKSEWRTMDTLDQAWVLKRNAHEYTGGEAVEVTRLAGLLTVAYMHLHATHPALPFGGYYAFGVCQDGVSAIEQKLTGHVTLFPNTADEIFFTDPRDPEVNSLIAAIPKDREGKKPEPERIFGSLPTPPAAGNPQHAFDAVTIPGLASDLNLSYAAWKDGSLERTHTRWDTLRALLFLGSAAAFGIWAAVKTRQAMNKSPVQRKLRR